MVDYPIVHDEFWVVEISRTYHTKPFVDNTHQPFDMIHPKLVHESNSIRPEHCPIVSDDSVRLRIEFTQTEHKIVQRNPLPLTFEVAGFCRAW